MDSLHQHRNQKNPGLQHCLVQSDRIKPARMQAHMHATDLDRIWVAAGCHTQTVEWLASYKTRDCQWRPTQHQAQKKKSQVNGWYTIHSTLSLYANTTIMSSTKARRCPEVFFFAFHKIDGKGILAVMQFLRSAYTYMYVIHHKLPHANRFRHLSGVTWSARTPNFRAHNQQRGRTPPFCTHCKGEGKKVCTY